MQTLAICRLDLSDFRCYRQLRLTLDSRPVVLTGENGAGKTNLLESLSFLAPGRGLRHASAGDVARFGSENGPAWAIAAQLAKNEDRWSIGIGRDGDGRRQVHLNGSPGTSADIAQLLTVLWLTPAMDRLFIDGASGRRRFMDRLTLGQDSQHGRRVAAYERAMRERMVLLRNESTPDPRWLDGLEEEMARHGARIAQARHAAMTALDQQCRTGVDNSPASGRPFPTAHLLTTGLAEEHCIHHDESATAAWLRQKFRDNRTADQAAGTTTFGPHKSDLSVRHGDKDRAAEDCSTGEQKAVLVSIILAQARLRQRQTGYAPLLLLDEIAAHLDQRRREALFAILLDLGSQCWMTGTDRSMFDPLQGSAQFIRVADTAACLEA